jgi:hypothetical protein
MRAQPLYRPTSTAHALSLRRCPFLTRLQKQTIWLILCQLPTAHESHPSAGQYMECEGAALTIEHASEPRTGSDAGNKCITEIFPFGTRTSSPPKYMDASGAYIDRKVHPDHRCRSDTVYDEGGGKFKSTKA